MPPAGGASGNTGEGPVSLRSAAGSSSAAGAYDPAADAVFNQTGVDVYFMEYDSERAGGLEPLRLLPKGKKRVLPGFIKV